MSAVSFQLNRSARELYLASKLPQAPFEHTGQGFVYVFSEPSGGWQNSAQAEQLAASDDSSNDYFGYSVAIGGGVIAAGGVESLDISPGYGSAYVFGQNQ